MVKEVNRFRAITKRSIAEEDSEPKPKRDIHQPVKKTIDEYCDETSLTPVTFLNKGHNIEQNYIWAILLLISIILCLYLIKLQYDRWKRTPLFLSMDNLPGDVSDIPFPAVTICFEPRGIFTKDQWFEKYLNESRRLAPLPPPGWMNQSLHTVYRTMWHVCGLYHILDNNQTLNISDDYNIEDTLNSILPPFKHSFAKCIISGETVPCELYFDKTYTSSGICYTYNGLNATEIYREHTYQHRYFLKDNLIRNKTRTLDWDIGTGYYDRKKKNVYPMRGTGAGYFAGIDLFLTQHENYLDRFCRFPEEGYKVAFHSPDAVPEVDATYYTLPYGLNLAISITPHYTHTHISSKSEPEIRRCYFPQERYLRFFNFYNRLNCDAECLSNYTLSKCGCVPFYMPRLLTTKVCNEHSIKCYFSAIGDYIYYEFVNTTAEANRCNCLIGCSHLSYTFLASVFDDPFDPKKKKKFFRRRRKNHKLYTGPQQAPDQTNVVLEGRMIIYMKSNKFRKMKQYEYYGLIDFLASCAGLISFFIGFSIICIGEWIYFSTVRLANNMSR